MTWALAYFQLTQSLIYPPFRLGIQTTEIGCFLCGKMFCCSICSDRSLLPVVLVEPANKCVASNNIAASYRRDTVGHIWGTVSQTSLMTAQEHNQHRYWDRVRWWKVDEETAKETRTQSVEVCVSVRSLAMATWRKRATGSKSIPKWLPDLFWYLPIQCQNAKCTLYNAQRNALLWSGTVGTATLAFTAARIEFYLSVWLCCPNFSQVVSEACTLY